MIDRSRKPPSVMFNVRGIGVAVSVSMSTSARRRFNRSLSLTPKRCSSSTITKPQPFELDVALQQLVRADHDVDGACREPFDRGRRAARAAESRQELDVHGPVREPILEGPMVLFGEQRRRHEHRDLIAGLHGDERRAQRDLGLAEADVAADDAVHRPRAGQVVEHAIDGGLLVLGLLERKLQHEALIARFVEVELRALRGRRVARRGSAARRPCRGPAARPCVWPCPTDPCRAGAAARPRATRRYSASRGAGSARARRACRRRRTRAAGTRSACLRRRAS